MRIENASFVVVDTETTGTNARKDRILEIAAVKWQRGAVVDTFARLVNPERSVPRRITQLTGITTAMVFEEAPARRVLPAFLEFIGDGVLVAHNLTFDVRFLNAELARAGRSALTNPSLCTLRLARRLLPGLSSKGLSSLIAFYDVRVEQRHRALGDAQATGVILHRLLSQVRYEYDVETLDDLLHFQHRAYQTLRKGPPHLRRIREEILPAVPTAPGVYFMKDRHGTVVYIGKAKSLRDRVRSYFTGIEGHPPRIRDLVNTVRDVEWAETGSELGALLYESKLIKEHKPRFNRALRRYRNRPFIRLETAHAAPRITVSRYVQNDGAEYYGPLGGRGQAELVVDVINRFFRLRECDDETFRMRRRCLYAAFGRCTAPCVDAAAAASYSKEVERVRLFLTGQDRTVLDHLQDAMRAAAASMAYEEAAEYRDWYRRLDRLMNRQEAVAAPVLGHNAVHVLPADAHDAAQLFLVRFGRLAETLTVSRSPKTMEVRRLKQRLAAHFDAAQERPERYLKQEVDEVHILAHWLSTQRTNGHSARWTPGMDLDVLADTVLHLVRTLPR